MTNPVTQAGLNDELLSAAKSGDVTEVSRLLAEGADINARGKDDETPLHAAVEEEREEIAELLISKGADVNAMADDGSTPLHWVKSKDVAKLLIANGADVNATDEKGKTPLYHALGSNLNRGTLAAMLRQHGGK